MNFIVTVKLPKNPEHDPKNKVTGSCEYSEYCTDVTGEHHSLITKGMTEDQIRRHFANEGIHVTRIEQVDL